MMQNVVGKFVIIFPLLLKHRFCSSQKILIYISIKIQLRKLRTDIDQLAPSSKQCLSC